MSTLLNDTKAVVTPRNIYNLAILNRTLPIGFEHTYHLTIPKKGDWYLNLCGGAEKMQIDAKEDVSNLRLILRKVPRKQIIFTEIRRESQPQRGEWYSAHLGRDGVRQWEGSEPRKAMDMGDFCTIYKREDREI